MARSRISVVVATRNRRDSLLHTLTRLAALPENPELIVVDNGSSDGSVDAVEAALPGARVIPLTENHGATARNYGVEAAATPYVAFSDDDSWWQANALARAAKVLTEYPHVGLLAGQVLVGNNKLPDPVSQAMARSPLSSSLPLPGRLVLGFIACGAIVRRSAFLDVGGFDETLAFTGEERLLAVDLATAGWPSVYVPDVVAEHVPSQQRDTGQRRRQTVRNDLWYAWLRLSPSGAAAHSWGVVKRALRDRDGRRGIASAVAGAPSVIRRREPLPARVELAAVRVSASRF